MADLSEGGSRDALEDRLRAMLPEAYRERYDEVQPLAMGSAGLKFGGDGRVAWNEMWATFCDLAMAGGPPHKGRLLEPASRAAIGARPVPYRQVVDEICRGIALAAGLEAEAAPAAGWIRVHCRSLPMAEWLLRAITMENVSVRSLEGATLDLPAGPEYRLEKEVKNVITVLAKTCHYWRSHTPTTKRGAIATLFERMNAESPLVQPMVTDEEPQKSSCQHLALEMGENLRGITGLAPSEESYAGWIGLTCPDVQTAVSRMRLLVASNILSRREGAVVFLPVNPMVDPRGELVTRALLRIHGLALHHTGVRQVT